jgi:hypothetical protein
MYKGTATGDTTAVDCLLNQVAYGGLISHIQWTLVHPVLGLTRAKTQGTDHSEPDQTELDNPVLWLIRSKSKGT